MDLVKVVWIDTNGIDDSWVSREDVLDITPIEMETIGYLVENDDVFVTVSGTVSDCRELFGNVNCIPRCCVRSIQPLKVDTDYLQPQDDC